MARVMLERGAAAPDFELRDGDGKVWRLTDLRGMKTILYFYPADDTPGCTVEACDFRDNRSVFEKAGYRVLGVSAQDADSHRSFSDRYSLNFPLLIDSDLEVARKYGVERTEKSDWKGIPLPTRRATFVINENGMIDHAEYDVHARGHVGRLSQALGV